jgi:hypothetical protein
MACLVRAHLRNANIIKALTTLTTNPEALEHVRTLLNHPTQVYCDHIRPTELQLYAFVGATYVHIRIEFQMTTDGLDACMFQLSQKRRYCAQVFFWAMHTLDSAVKIPKLLASATQNWIRPMKTEIPSADLAALLLPDRSVIQQRMDMDGLLSLSQAALKDVICSYPVVRRRIERGLFDALKFIYTKDPSDPYAWEQAMALAQLACKLDITCPKRMVKLVRQQQPTSRRGAIYQRMIMSRLIQVANSVATPAHRRR